MLAFNKFKQNCIPYCSGNTPRTKHTGIVPRTDFDDVLNSSYEGCLREEKREKNEAD